METRLIVAGDAPVLAALHAAGFPDAPWSHTQISGSLALPTTTGLLACEDETPLGFILCQMAGDESEILTFCTALAARRRGIGNALLAQALQTARAQGIMRMFLDVAADNAAALALYEKNGFRPIGKRKNYYPRARGAVDAIMLEKIW